MSDHLERLKAFLDAWPAKPVPGLEEADLIAEGVMAGDPDLYASDLNAAVAELKRLRAIVAEGNQRDRALALLLLRSGGQVEFTHSEQVSAPWHGHLISYPNLATGGLVLAYSADGETVGAAPQQPARDGGETT